MKTFGQTLRVKRATLTISTLNEFADLCGLKANFLTQIERQGKFCSTDKLRNILKLFKKKDQIDIVKSYFKQKGEIERSNVAIWETLEKNPESFLKTII